jgi:hypothetical protein
MAFLTCSFVNITRGRKNQMDEYIGKNAMDNRHGSYGLDQR